MPESIPEVELTKKLMRAHWRIVLGSICSFGAVVMPFAGTSDGDRIGGTLFYLVGAVLFWTLHFRHAKRLRDSAQSGSDPDSPPGMGTPSETARQFLKPENGSTHPAGTKMSAPAQPRRVAPTSAESQSDQPASSERIWHKALNRYNAIRDEYAAYATDPTQFFFRPLLSDLDHPAVQRFHDAFASADALRLDDHVPDDFQIVREFADRVSVAETAWRRADTAARNSGVSPFTTDQQKLLRRASRAISIALDESTPVNERSAAFTRVLQLFEKAQIAPPPSVTDTLRRQIEAATQQGLSPPHPR